MNNQKLDPFKRPSNGKDRCIIRIWLSEQNMVGVETVPGMPIDAAIDMLNKAALTLKEVKKDQAVKGIKGNYINALKRFFGVRNAGPN